jgi:glucose-1-phosphatase
MKTPASSAELLKRWALCPHTTAYEAGSISAEQWAERFIRDWEVSLAPAEFLTEFTMWCRGFFPGAVELLEELRGRYRLGALSNSNALHWKRNEDIGILREFDLAVASHEVGVCKPEPAIFHALLERARVSPDAVVFFDDLEANVAGARACGIRAFRVEAIDGVRNRLLAERLL